MVVKSFKSHRRGRSYNNSAFKTSWESSFLSWKTLEGGPRLRIITDLLTQIGTHVENGDIELQYVPTKEMPADCLTKPFKRDELVRARVMLGLF